MYVLSENIDIGVYEWHMRLLEEAKTGIYSTFINGALAPYTMLEIIYEKLRDGSYMHDFIADDAGNIIQLCFDKVTYY